jgi:hypothetical protein
VNRDLIEESGGVNLYGFVGNDGVNLLDLFGLQKNTREQCEANLNSAMEDPAVKKILASIRGKENCGEPNIGCEECCKFNPNAITWGGYHSGTGANGGSSTVQICFGGQADKDKLGTATYLRHELIHAYDACDGNLDCEAAACSEVRAYRLMGGKPPKPGLFPNLSKQNIRSRALRSLMSNEACGPESERAATANAALDAVFDQCYENFLPLY